MKKPQIDIVLSSERKQNPALIYLAGLSKEISRNNQRYDLDALARQLGGVDAFSFNWAALRYEDTIVIQTRLLQKYKPRTVARIMAAVKGTLKAARKLRLMSAEDYETAVDLPKIKRGKSIT